MKRNSGCKGGNVLKALELIKSEGLAEEKCLAYNVEDDSCNIQ